ncbi:MAG: hypothetical protein ETSY2_53390 [Candidatus Entotheonella gemina]|uniref:Uncharacterized protein n=1 Tax=Candidatus Entotheonella gemina TaxID=1429439 RepID=W4L3H9_9BACT|nr:MAG: hypothetical protein ETSY2_53390 [Candidatus Entotheonella gemina]
MIEQSINLLIGILSGLLTAIILRLTTTIFDFIPRNLDTTLLHA